MSLDRVPYVGRLNRRSKHVFVATGYSKWGMTAGTVAAELLADAVLGRENPWAGLYDSKRLKPKATAVKFVKENASTGFRFFAQRFARGEKRAPEKLAAGEGAILRVGGLKRAVYKDDGGDGARPLAGLPSPVVLRRVERGRAELGLPLPRLSLHGRGAGDPGPERPGSPSSRLRREQL